MAKWFPDKRGLAVGLAVAGYGGGSAIFGPMANLWLIPTYGWRATFTILGVIFFVMTLVGAFLLKNPPAGYQPCRAGCRLRNPSRWPRPTSSRRARRCAPRRSISCGSRTRWARAAGLMVISQLVPFAKSMKIPGEALAAITLVIGAAGNALGPNPVGLDVRRAWGVSTSCAS